MGGMIDGWMGCEDGLRIVLIFLNSSSHAVAYGYMINHIATYSCV